MDAVQSTIVIGGSNTAPTAQKISLKSNRKATVSKNSKQGQRKSTGSSKSLGRVIGALSITENNITPVTTALTPEMLSANNDSGVSETKIDFSGALEEALNWDPNKRWDDSSDSSCDSSGDFTTDSSDYSDEEEDYQQTPMFSE